MDFVQSLDSGKLLRAGASLSFILSVYPAVSYNFPLFLFGTWVQESPEAINSLRTFTAFIVASSFFDLFALFFSEELRFWTKLLIFLLIALKVPISFSFIAALRQRGGELGLGVGGPNLSGPTIWSMPGGFTSTGNDRYQTVDDDASFIRASRPPQPPAHHAPAPPPAGGPAAPPGAYQTV